MVVGIRRVRKTAALPTEKISYDVRRSIYGDQVTHVSDKRRCQGASLGIKNTQEIQARRGQCRNIMAWNRNTIGPSRPRQQTGCNFINTRKLRERRYAQSTEKRPECPSDGARYINLFGVSLCNPCFGLDFKDRTQPPATTSQPIKKKKRSKSIYTKPLVIGAQQK
ncbi:hypothetical protein VUR80DRAFT_7153 [Thermomyces stellatus]